MPNTDGAAMSLGISYDALDAKHAASRHLTCAIHQQGYD
jgi:hypothetical protein